MFFLNISPKGNNKLKIHSTPVPPSNHNDSLRVDLIFYQNVLKISEL